LNGAAAAAQGVGLYIRRPSPNEALFKLLYTAASVKTITSNSTIQTQIQIQKRKKEKKVSEEVSKKERNKKLKGGNEEEDRPTTKTL
jgi:hypothetical protein